MATGVGLLLKTRRTTKTQKTVHDIFPLRKKLGRTESSKNLWTNKYFQIITNIFYFSKVSISNYDAVREKLLTYLKVCTLVRKSNYKNYFKITIHKSIHLANYQNNLQNKHAKTWTKMQIKMGKNQKQLCIQTMWVSCWL